MGELRSVCVYCGSNAGSRPAYAERAAQLGTRLAHEGLALVYGGGNVGLMGIVADAALAAGGEVIGVIPEQLVKWEVAHRGVTRLEVVANMHERKARICHAHPTLSEAIHDAAMAVSKRAIHKAN